MLLAIWLGEITIRHGQAATVRPDRLVGAQRKEFPGGLSARTMLALSVCANSVTQLRLNGLRRSVWRCRSEWKDSCGVECIFALFQ